MENFIVDEDVKVIYIAATSFPGGIQKAAHETLHTLFAGEAESLGGETVVIKRGQYICLTVLNFRNDMGSIGKAFRELLLYPHLDPRGFCVELYLNR